MARKKIGSSIESLLEELQVAYMDIEQHLRSLGDNYKARQDMIDDERNKQGKTDNDGNPLYNYTVDVRFSDQQVKLAKAINEAQKNRIDLIKTHESIIRRTVEGKIQEGSTQQGKQPMSDEDLARLKEMASKELNQN